VELGESPLPVPGLDLSQAAEVEQPAGAFLMFRREVWQQLGVLTHNFIHSGLRTWIF